VKSKGGVTVLYSDVVMNVKQAGLVMRLTGFVGGPKTPAIWKMVFVSDKPALKAHFERTSATPGLTGLVPCHGEIVRDGAAVALRTIAAGI
jgi:hypothetical protein